MKRTFITAILFAITASNVNAQQTTVTNQQYWVAPNGNQSYQRQSSYQPQGSQYPVQSQPGYYQPQPLQSPPQQPTVPQQDPIQTYYYPQSNSAGVASQPSPAGNAQLKSVLQNDLQLVENQKTQPSQAYLALPTKSRPPAPSIPPQPGDPLFPSSTALVETGQSSRSGQHSVLNQTQSQASPTGQRQASSSTTTAPAPSIPFQTGEHLAPSTTATVASQLAPKVTPEAPLESQNNSLVGDLVVTPKADLTASAQETSLAEEALAKKKLASEKLAAAEARVAADKLAADKLAADKLAAAEKLAAADKLAAAEELAAAEKLAAAEELAAAEALAAEEQAAAEASLAAQELAATEPSDEAVNKLSFENSPEQPANELGGLSIKSTESVNSSNAASDSVVSDLATNEQVSPTELTQSTAQKAAAETKTETAAPISTTPLLSTKAKNVATNSVAVKPRRSSYGGWMWAIIPILGGVFIGWLAWQKRKRDAKERRFAEAALHRVNTRKPTAAPTTTQAAATKTTVAPTAAIAPAKEKTASAEVVASVTAASIATRSSQLQEPKVQAPATPLKDVSTAGILSMDDLNLAELTGNDFYGKSSAKATPEASSGAVESYAESKARIELETDIVESSSRDYFTSISGIDDATENALHKAGYLSFDDLAKASERELQLALSKHSHEFSSADFNRWAVQAAAAMHLKTDEDRKPKSALPETAATTTASSQADDLTKIRGIGPATAALLQAAGITTFATLSQAGTPRLQEILDIGGEKFAAVDPSMWCRQAEFTSAKAMPRMETATLALDVEPEKVKALRPTMHTVPLNPAATELPIAQRKTASSAPHDDLTKIAGIELATQQILNRSGITQVEQLAGMTSDQLKELLANQPSEFRSLDPTSWPVQARALMTRLNDESDVLAQVNSIIDIAKSSASNAPAKPDSLTTDANAEKTALK